MVLTLLTKKYGIRPKKCREFLDIRPKKCKTYTIIRPKKCKTSDISRLLSTIILHSRAALLDAATQGSRLDGELSALCLSLRDGVDRKSPEKYRALRD